MKGLFIINPSSGKQNIDSMLREIMATLILDQICSHVDVFYTKGKDDAKNRAAELKPGDYDFIVSVGGDGTLNEVTNGLILSESNIPMAIISAGTVNDFATYMKLPQTADGFCQMIKDFQTKKVACRSERETCTCGIVTENGDSETAFEYFCGDVVFSHETESVSNGEDCFQFVVCFVPGPEEVVVVHFFEVKFVEFVDVIL